MTTCIRGCTDRCREDHEHDDCARTPRPADVGLLCRKDADVLKARLADIPDLYAQLDVRLTASGDRAGSRHTKVSGSPALIRLDVLALMDPRTNPNTGARDIYGYLHEDDDLRDVFGTIGGWARVLCEEHNLSSPIDTLGRAAQLLITWMSTACAEPWIDDLYNDVELIHRMLFRATDQPKPDAWCFGQDPRIGCGAPLFYERDPKADPKDPDESKLILKCHRVGCGRTYRSEAELVRLAIQAEREGRKRA